MAKKNTKKRKSASSQEDTDTNKRQRKLETFFKPQVTVRPFDKHDKNNGTRKLVALNEEQIRVRQMVVDEGKNVFFTGSAGSYYSIYELLSCSIDRPKFLQDRESRCCSGQSLLPLRQSTPRILQSSPLRPVLAWPHQILVVSHEAHASEVAR